jgi:hypothetical protein
MSSSKGFFFQREIQDKILSELPKYIPSSSSSSTSFRTHYELKSDDPELFMGDDCDTEYEQMLMNSDFMDWLNKNHPNLLFQSNKSNERLKMVLAHFKQSQL